MYEGTNRFVLQDARGIPLEQLDREHTQVSVDLWRAKHKNRLWWRRGDMLGCLHKDLQGVLAQAWVSNPVRGHPLFGDLYRFGKEVPRCMHIAIWTENNPPIYDESLLASLRELRYEVHMLTSGAAAQHENAYQLPAFKFIRRVG